MYCTLNASWFIIHFYNNKTLEFNNILKYFYNFNIKHFNDRVYSSITPTHINQHERYPM
jgi:hypothetical protein